MKAARQHKRGRIIIGALTALGLAMQVNLVAPAWANTWIPYYTDHFKSPETCKSRGAELVRTVIDIVNYRCFRENGDTKWSMYVEIYDEFGCLLATAEKHLTNDGC